MRIATWNMKQAVGPKQPLPQLWEWARDVIEPDVVALTEAKVPKTGLPAGWTALWQPDGIGPRRRWGTVLAARGVELRPVEAVTVGRRTLRMAPHWPATTVVADVMRNGERWATVVGLYALTVDQDGSSCGHGGYSLPRSLRDLEPLLDSDRGSRVVIAGDFNLWPQDVQRPIAGYDLVDLIEFTGNERSPLERCAQCEGAPGCGHLWTHRNGNSPGAKVQQIDFILATEAMTSELSHVYGGVGDFPDAWDVSDHAPVVADFH